MSDAHDPQQGPSGAPSREMSVSLRQGAAAAPPDLADPANQSLAEALRFTFKLIQGAMLVLFVLFAFSGLQSVRVGESGVRLFLGRKTGDNLPPGFQISFPYPLGEIIKVDTGTVELAMEREYFEGNKTEEQLRNRAGWATHGNWRLTPGTDGMLLTAEGSIVHSQWRVVYRRSGPGTFVQNIHPEHERAIVRGAAMRAIVRSVGETSIDDLLKQSSGDQGSVSVRTRQIAQSMLDEIGAGITIDQMVLEAKTPPLRLIPEFANVQSAEQTARKAVENAGAESRKALTEMAGAAAPYLVEQIDAYERAIAAGDERLQREVMARIEGLMSGRPTEIDGRTIESVAAGRTSALLADANQYRSSVVEAARARLASFSAKLRQYRSNPRVMAQREWSEAMRELLSRDTTELFMSPPNSALYMRLNRDADKVKAIEAARKRAEVERAQRERERRMNESNYTTDTEVRTQGG